MYSLLYFNFEMVDNVRWGSLRAIFLHSNNRFSWAFPQKAERWSIAVAFLEVVFEIVKN
jgi:hypothetical protein